jgi:hypothetical protein
VTYPSLNFIIGSFTDPRIVLDALASVTEVKVVSSPSVVVVDNQPALLKVGDDVPVSTQQTSTVELPNAPIVSSIRFRDTGVILKVIPRVNQRPGDHGHRAGGQRRGAPARWAGSASCKGRAHLRRRLRVRDSCEAC